MGMEIFYSHFSSEPLALSSNENDPSRRIDED